MIICFMIWLLIETLIYKELVFDTISYSLNIWMTNLIPSMFPFFVISDMLIDFHIIDFIPKWIKRFFSFLFGIGDASLVVFFLSCISGFPSNARIIRKMYDDGYICLDEANHALIFTHFSNPLFVLSVVAGLFFHNEKYGIIILISHYLGNFVLGIVTRKQAFCSSYDYTEKFYKSQNFSSSFIKAIRRAVDTLLLIFGILTCFLIFSAFFIQLFQLSIYPSTIFRGFLEMTMGLKQLSLLEISDLYKVIIATCFLSFGGLSVHLQVLSQLIDTNISYHFFLNARIFHVIISGFICFLLFCFLI